MTEQVRPTATTVAEALRAAHEAARAQAAREDIPLAEADRCNRLAWLTGVLVHVLVDADGRCGLAGMARADDLVAGAVWLAEQHAERAAALGPSAANTPEVRSAQARARFLGQLVASLPAVGEAGEAGAILRVWSTVVLGLVQLCTSGQIPPKMQRPYLDELRMWALETTWLASFDLVVGAAYAAWMERLVPTDEPCGVCARVGTESLPNGSHPRTGEVACYEHRASLPAVEPVDDCPEAVAAVVFAQVGDDVLLANGPEYDLPGGKREPGETARECARRELAEEAAATVPLATLRYCGAAKTHDGQPMAVFATKLAAPPQRQWCVVDGQFARSGGKHCVLVSLAHSFRTYRADRLDAYRGVIGVLRGAGVLPAEPSAEDRAEAAPSLEAEPGDGAAPTKADLRRCVEALAENAAAEPPARACVQCGVPASSTYCGPRCETRASMGLAPSTGVVAFLTNDGAEAPRDPR